MGENQFDKDLCFSRCFFFNSIVTMYAYFELYKGARLDDDQLPIRCTKVLLLMFSKGKIQIYNL